MKKFFFIATVCIAMLSLQPAGAYAQETNNKYTETFYKLMEKSGILNNMKQMVPDYIPMMKKLYPSQPDSFWDEYTKRWGELFAEKITERLLPVYQKYFTQEDLEALLDFHNTPTGRKLAANNPSINKETIQIGKELYKEIEQEIKQEFPLNEQ